MKVSKAVLSRPRILLVLRAIILFKKNILLIQRSRNDSSNPLKWELPGGKFDKGQDFHQAIEREIIEEVGIYATKISPLAFVESAIDTTTKYKGVPYIRMTGLYRTDTDDVRLSSEHEAYKWVTFDKVMEMDLRDDSRKSLLAWENEIKKS